MRIRCAQVDDLAADDPAMAVARAALFIPDALKIGPCAVAECLGVRGSAFRRLGDHDQAEQDLAGALAICSCRFCFPRIRRRQALLWVHAGHAELALELAEEAVVGFKDLVSREGVGQALYARAAAHWASGDIASAIADAKEALRLLTPASGLYFIGVLQLLACSLTFSGHPEDWREALRLIGEAKSGLRHLNGGKYRILKLKLRWIEILAELQVGVGRNHAKRLHEVFRELIGLGLKVPKHQAEKEIERARRAARKDPLGLAGVVADMSLAGGRPAWVAWASRAVQEFLPEESPVLSELGRLSIAAKSGQDLRSIALAVRSHCLSAPALPPCFEAA